MNKKPTDAELEVLQILWEHGPATVRLVNQKLSENREVVYTTTLKMMQVMTEKGFLRRDTSQRKHLYEAIITESETQEKMLNKLLETAFRGSPLKLVMQTLGHEKTSKDDLDKIKALIKKMENNRS